MLTRHRWEDQPLGCCCPCLLLYKPQKGLLEGLQLVQQRLVQKHQHPATAAVVAAVTAAVAAAAAAASLARQQSAAS